MIYFLVGAFSFDKYEVKSEERLSFNHDEKQKM